MKVLNISALSLIIFCFVWSPNEALADMGPKCSCDAPGEGQDCFWYNPELDMGSSACKEYAVRSAFCKYVKRNDDKDLVFNGFWSEYKNESAEVLSPVEHCTQFCDTGCPLSKPEEGDADYVKMLALYNKCLDYFKPQDIDCQSISNETDRNLCEQICHNNILTSQCGTDCLTGQEHDGVDTFKNDKYSLINNYDTSNAVEFFCSQEKTCSYYSSSISVNRPSSWSLLAILVAALAAVTTLLIAFYSKSNKNDVAK